MDAIRKAQPSWVATKAVLLQSLGGIYLMAFVAAYHQNEGLMGKHGLMPAIEFWGSVQQRYDGASLWEKFQSHPSIFWFVELNDDNMRSLVLSGLTLSVLLLLRQGVCMLQLFTLWIVYFSIVTSAEGTSFYGYGWESQLLETGFLAIFLCQNIFPSLSKTTQSSPPSPIILWLFRWLSFRISIGAGLIKIRGDSCWTQKTCLLYHFETQPIPSPTSFFFHFLPPIMLKHAVDLDLFVQVYTSWMVLLPTYIPGCPKLSALSLRIVRWGGVIQAAFMVNIVLSGNLGFLPHLTIIPALACLDDSCWPRWVGGKCDNPRNLEHQDKRQWVNPREMLNVSYAVLVLYLSRPVVSNLLQLNGKRQQMNASFDPFRLVGTYGAFGSVGKQRYEPIVSISYDTVDNANGTVHQNDLKWIELEFPCKPGSLTRRPCFCEPYHYRLDWNIWFIGFKPHEAYLNRRESWLYALLGKLLTQNEDNSRPWLSLLDRSSAEMLRSNYDENGRAPTYAKVDMYHYQMAAPLWEVLPRYLIDDTIQWWNRTFEESLIPVVALRQQTGKLYRAL